MPMGMKMKIAFYDTKPYDRIWFEPMGVKRDFKIKFFEYKLNAETAFLANGFDVVCAFVNDIIDENVIDILCEFEIRLIVLRCAGYNNVDFKHAYGKIHILRVPGYSPAAVAEHAAAMLLSLNRKIHRSYVRTRDNNFSINGLMGMDLRGKTAGIIGTGKIGQLFVEICRGFGMQVMAFDPFPLKKANIRYESLDTIFRECDIISLHCPLSPETEHIVNRQALNLMKEHAVLINTSRGGLVNTADLLEALKNKTIGGACLDVYEEESEYFFEDLSDEIVEDDILERLLTLPNVIITSHQGFFTQEAMKAIAETTLENIESYIQDKPLVNEICYRCGTDACKKQEGKNRCF